MDELFSPRGRDLSGEPQGTVHLDPLLERLLERRPWEVRSAQWRAWQLAEMAFGKGVEATLTGRGGDDTFRGILNLSVPFRTMDDHRRREAAFLAWAHEDPILSRVPLVFIFHPDPVPAPAP